MGNTAQYFKAFSPRIKPYMTCPSKGPKDIKGLPLSSPYGK